MIKRKAIEIYCCMLLGTSAFPQISDVRPDMRRRALFVTSRAACRWNRMLVARENVDGPLVPIVVTTVHNSRCASGCQPPSIVYLRIRTIRIINEGTAPVFMRDILSYKETSPRNDPLSRRHFLRLLPSPSSFCSTIYPTPLGGISYVYALTLPISIRPQHCSGTPTSHHKSSEVQNLRFKPKGRQ